MSPTLEDDLRSALRACIVDVTARPDLAATVLRGGARRRTGRRVALVSAPVAVVAVVAAVAAAVLVTGAGGPAPRPTLAALTATERAVLARPTGGDLAGDPAYRADVVDAWEGSHRSSPNADRGIFDHPAGDPVVSWAGTTPAGRAAVVVQVFDLREHENVQLDRAGPALLWGFVGPGKDGRPVVVADGYPVPGAPSVEAALVGADRTVLLVADRGRPAQVSWGLTYTADAQARRSWQDVRFAGGAAAVPVPPRTSPSAIALRVTGGMAEIANADRDRLGPDGRTILGPPDNRLPWVPAGTASPVWAVGPQPYAAWGGRPDGGTAEDALNAGLAGRLPETWPDVGWSLLSRWFVVGTTPDGSRVVAGERQLNGDPSRAYAVLRAAGGATRAVAAPIDRTAAVPVRLRLPGGQGWLVAAKGRMFTWTEDGTPRSARNAALVPVGASDLQADGAPIPLS
jgi:hypothetical protein